MLKKVLLTLATFAVAGALALGADPLHAASAKLLLALLIMHVAANWRPVVAGLGRKRGTSHHDE